MEVSLSATLYLSTPFIMWDVGGRLPQHDIRERKQCSSMHTQNSTTNVRKVGQNEFEKDYRTVS